MIFNKIREQKQAEKTPFEYSKRLFPAQIFKL